jgi:hypothetical protein
VTTSTAPHARRDSLIEQPSVARAGIGVSIGSVPRCRAVAAGIQAGRPREALMYPVKTGLEGRFGTCSGDVRLARPRSGHPIPRSAGRSVVPRPDTVLSPGIGGTPTWPARADPARARRSRPGRTSRDSSCGRPLHLANPSRSLRFAGITHHRALPTLDAGGCARPRERHGCTYGHFICPLQLPTSRCPACGLHGVDRSGDWQQWGLR